jgi:hypothetical protein
MPHSPAERTLRHRPLATQPAQFDAARVVSHAIRSVLQDDHQSALVVSERNRVPFPQEMKKNTGFGDR